jgi:hypothetical protein
MEQTFGSLLLMRLTQDDSSIASWKRVDPTFRATALLRNNGSETDWAEYSEWFTSVIAASQVSLSDDDVPAYEITHCAQETGRPGRVSLAPEPTRLVRLVAPESLWGGRSAEDPFAALTEEPEMIRQRTKARNEKLRKLNEKAAKPGNTGYSVAFHSMQSKRFSITHLL